MRFLVLLLAIIAAASLAAQTVQAQDQFESALAAEVPEFAEVPANSFMTLETLGEEQDPQASFAELASDADSDNENENEMESETENEGEMEADSEVEGEMEAESEAESEESDAAFVEESASGTPLPWHRSDKIQPIARNKAEITCIDGDCTRATKVAKAKVGTHPNANTKPPPTKLDIALGAVKEEIMVRAKELHKEKDWSKKVAKLIDEYQQKLSKVTGNIAHLRAQTKALLRKKKQIQNVQVQNKLRYKLQLAQADLNRLQKQMEHIAGKENEFADTEKLLKGTMNQLKNSLLKLRGQEPQKLAKEGI